MMKRLLASGLLALALVLSACSVPQSTSGYEIPDSGAPAVKTIGVETGWTYVSAEQNALEQAREKALGTKLSTLFGCPDDYVCLYHWIEYGGGRWQAHRNILNGACWNLSGSTYTDGYNVNNSSGSLVTNWSGTTRFWLGMYDWVGCNPAGQVWAFDATHWVLKHDLSALTPQAWHKWTSVELDIVG